MTPVTLKYSQLIEGTIYDKHFDGTLRQCLKNSKSCEDSLRYGTLGVQMQNVYDALETERSATAGNAGDAADAPDPAPNGDADGNGDLGEEDHQAGDGAIFEKDEDRGHKMHNNEMFYKFFFNHFNI